MSEYFGKCDAVDDLYGFQLSLKKKKKMERTSNLGSVFLGGDNQPALIAEKAAT